MSVTRHLTHLFSFDTSIFAKEALRSTFMRSQGAMNFLFIRIYKSANIEHLEKNHKENWIKINKIAKNFENSYKQSGLYLLHLMKKEIFRKFIRDLFMSASSLERLSNYLQWQRSHEAGLSTASLFVCDIKEINYF
mmetsp:Transcript_25309/g.28066  ORF Transcript_25309/g.28066 Transcript_25309/m.28066 type:complete len:136 (-) Transcript_25309:397-804(-)